MPSLHVQVLLHLRKHPEQNCEEVYGLHTTLQQIAKLTDLKHFLSLKYHLHESNLNYHFPHKKMYSFHNLAPLTQQKLKMVQLQWLGNYACSVNAF
ncbi:unnamed protein product [Lasius platythorax]|uniref:Uncharacterized protein n=1 Tax=Lasius platythorax TaxID=488582 RepID=A0AAV2N0L2_9HYME